MDQTKTPLDSAVKPQAEPAALRITLPQMVDLCIEKEASDIHFGEGRRIALRVGGKIVFIQNLSPLSLPEVQALIDTMMPSEDARQRLSRVREIDFSYTSPRGVSFRVNVFYQRGRLSAVMRMIPKYLPTLDDLGIPEEMKGLLTLKEGLLLIAGTAGSGKSLTVQAMLEYINENFVEHIITIENPIEHLFEDKKSIVTQRELGKDTLSLANALQSAVREDPNIIMVSEINDMDTLDQVLKLVETGHLVISSVLSKNVTQALERLVGFYSSDRQKQVQNRLADALKAVLAQDLADRIDNKGRVAIYEFMLTDQSLHNLIKEGQWAQIRTAIQSGGIRGMITMDAYAEQLAEQHLISPETARDYMEQ